MTDRYSLVSRVRSFIDEHFAEGISLADVARALNYSPGHLTSIVRRTTGRPVTAWIIERRLLAARKLLLTTDSTVAAVAEAVGFRDIPYFVRRFARDNGTSPARWRMDNLVQSESCSTCPMCGTSRIFEAAS